MTPDEFRRLGHQLVDWVADYREHISERRVVSDASPGSIKALLPPSPPEHGGQLGTIAHELDRVVMPGITHWNHPGFFAYFPSVTSLPSVLADLITAGLGAQGMSWQTSPAATEVEEVMMDWVRQMVGLPSTFSGVIQDTASTSTLVALLCARERSTQRGLLRGGLQAEPAPLIVYTSEQAHSSVEKAALLAGFGRENLRLIPTDGDHALDVRSLQAAIEKDLAAGKVPCAIVATVGTTATTAVDPLERIAPIAETFKTWLHVDAAMAGTAMVLPECRWMWKGIERADSLVFNPHKWMGAGFDCSAYYVRDPQALLSVMSTDPSYLRTAQDGAVKNLRDWGIPLGRRFRSLKLWMLLLDQGVEGIRTRLRRDLENAKWLEAQVKSAPEWELLAPVSLQTVCLRHRPMRLPESEWNGHNTNIAAKVNATGRAYVTPSLLKTKQMIRVSIGAEPTERGDVENVWKLLQQSAAR